MLADDGAASEVSSARLSYRSAAQSRIHLSMSTVSVALLQRMAQAHAQAGSPTLPPGIRPARDGGGGKLFIVRRGRCRRDRCL